MPGISTMPVTAASISFILFIAFRHDIQKQKALHTYHTQSHSNLFCPLHSLLPIRQPLFIHFPELFLPVRRYLHSQPLDCPVLRLENLCNLIPRHILL